MVDFSSLANSPRAAMGRDCAAGPRHWSSAGTHACTTSSSESAITISGSQRANGDERERGGLEYGSISKLDMAEVLARIDWCWDNCSALPGFGTCESAATACGVRRRAKQ